MSDGLTKTLRCVPRECRGAAVSIGNFDGVHRGHVAIVKSLLALARRKNAPAVVFTFDPHPLKVLAPERAPTPLMWASRKVELLQRLGVDAVVVCPADRALLALSPEAFFREVLVERLGATGVVEGPDFRFGKGRAGDRADLERLCREHSMELVICPPVEDEGGVISSSRIRDEIRRGDVAAANRKMFAPYRICGRVVRGARRGRTLGFPTANLSDIPVLVPGVGVYAGRAYVDARRLAAAIHIGPNPTFGEELPKVEVHLLDGEWELEGRMLEVEFLERLREVRPFDSVEALREQLERDVAAVRQKVTEISAG